MAVPIDQLEVIQRIFPSWIQHLVRIHADTLEELALQEGRPPSLWLGDRFIEGPRPVKRADIEQVRARLKGEFGVEFREDGRAGIDGTLHRISTISDRYGRLVGITVRFARIVKGLADPIVPFILSGKSLLIIGPPGVGKTTLLRDVIRQLAAVYGPKVVVVDTSNEIGGEGRVAHPVLGASKRLQVRIPNPALGENHLHMLARTYYEAVANHGPQIVVGDEVTSSEDVAVVETIGRRGVWAVVTVHGRVLEDVLGNPVLHPLIGYPDMDRGKLRGSPVFDMAMEVRGRGYFHLYLSLDEALRKILAGRCPDYIEIRYRPDGAHEVVAVSQETGMRIPYALPPLEEKYLRMMELAEDRERLMYQVFSEGLERRGREESEESSLEVPLPRNPASLPGAVVPGGERLVGVGAPGGSKEKGTDLPKSKAERLRLFSRELIAHMG